MEKQLKQFYKFLEVDKKVSNNTLQSYKRDLKQFSEYLDEKGIKYNKVTEQDIKEYLEYLSEEEGKKPSTISRTIASIRAFYQYEVKNKKYTITKNRKKNTLYFNVTRSRIIIRATKRCRFKRNKRQSNA